MKVVAVIAGGASPEHSISIVSARFILAHIDRSRYLPVFFIASSDYRWYKIPEDDWADCLQETAQSGVEITWRRGGYEDQDGYVPVASVFSTMHGTHGEDGHVQGFLSILQISYVGSGVLASVIGMHKHVFKAVMQANNFPVLPYLALDQAISYEEASRGLMCQSLFVKPSAAGSSYGTSVVQDAASWASALELAFAYDETVLVEPYLPQVREVECAVWVERAWASTLGEIVVREGFYDYEQKYVTDSVDLKIPAQLSAAMSESMRHTALEVCRRVGVRGYARVDFFLHEDKFYINEINTLPGMTPISMFPALLSEDGWSPDVWVNEMIARAGDG